MVSLLFIFWPAAGEPAVLVTEWSRVVLTFACFALCASVYKITGELPRVLHRPLSTLGEASYSVYLIHPIVFSVFSFLFADHLPTPALISVATAATLVASWICYRYFETYFIGLGRKVSARRTSDAGALTGAP